MSSEIKIPKISLINVICAHVKEITLAEISSKNGKLEEFLYS